MSTETLWCLCLALSYPSSTWSKALPAIARQCIQQVGYRLLMSMSYHFKHLVIDTYTQKRIRQRQDEKSYPPFTVPCPSIHNCRKHPRTQTLPILSFSWIKLSTKVCHVSTHYKNVVSHSIVTLSKFSHFRSSFCFIYDKLLYPQNLFY